MKIKKLAKIIIIIKKNEKLINKEATCHYLYIYICLLTFRFLINIETL